MASEQTPDLDDLCALLDIVPDAPFELIGADHSSRTVSIYFGEDIPRAELEEQAEAAMALLMDLPATLRGLITQVTSLTRELERATLYCARPDGVCLRKRWTDGGAT